MLKLKEMGETETVLSLPQKERKDCWIDREIDVGINLHMIEAWQSGLIIFDNPKPN